MKHLKIQPHVLPLFTLALISMLFVTPPYTFGAGDVGVGRRTGSVVDIDEVSAVNGSTVVRSLPTQEGAPQGFPPGPMPDLIRILNLATGASLGSGNASADGQYNIGLLNPLTTGQRIQAVNVTRGFSSAGVTVSAAWAPAIDEPVLKGKPITGRGAPGSTIQIKNAVTGVVLGTGTVAPAPSNGKFTVTLSRSLPLFHTIQAHDVTKALPGKKIVPILDLLTDHSPLNLLCGVNLPIVSGGFTRRTFTCGLPHPRGITLDTQGNPLIVSGTAPRDPGYAFLPAGLFRLSLADRKLSLFAPVSGVALKSDPGGNLFLARPHLFNVRKKVLVQPDEGEIFLVNPTSSQSKVFARLIGGFTPTGIALDVAGGLFAGDVLVSNFLGVGLRRISKATGAISPFTKLPGLQGLTFGPGGTSPFDNELYAAQPGSGQVLRIAANGSFKVFAGEMTSPVEVAFGPGDADFGPDLYVTDAGAGRIMRCDDRGSCAIFASGFRAPFGLVFRASPPALFVTDYLDGSVVQFTPVP